MRNTTLDKGVVTCACGSGSFVGVELGLGGNTQYRMTKNWDLTLTFEGSSITAPKTIFCGGCGEQVSVSPAVEVRGG